MLSYKGGKSNYVEKSGRYHLDQLIKVYMAKNGIDKMQ